jgi:hypothetical protein
MCLRFLSLFYLFGCLVIVFSTFCHFLNVLLRFLSLLPKINTLKEEKFILAQSFHFMAAWPCCFGPVAAQYFMVGACNGGGFSPDGSQEEKLTEEGSRFPIFPSRAHPQKADFLPLGSTL